NRSKFEQLTDDLVSRSIEPCRQALKDAGLTTNDIDEVILVGGSTRIPKIQEAVEQFFGKKPNKGVNPDEVVAIGAAIQGGVLSGDVKDVLLLDVTPLSMGIETMGGVYDVVIEANSTIPTKKSKIYSTAADNQPSVEIHILQGERPMAKDNRSIGRFILGDIPAAPRGTPQIEVTFDIDANGILQVTSKDKGTGKQQSIRIEASTGLSKEEIERMRTEAAANADADKKAKERIEKLNGADSMIFQSEKQLKEYGDKISAGNKTAIEAALNDLRDAHKTENFDKIDSASAALNNAWQAASQEMYQAGQTGADPGAGAGTESNHSHNNSNGASEDVTDVEFEEVDKN
ncbi:MAG TPA: Hsp70 family protein, partial [Saprospiraceae bacterium]|nr:Hsp70 family protein [Saprospiraceae bacterium]